MINIRDRVVSLLSEMNSGIYEKEHVMAMSLLVAIAGESIFLLGPPGVAKSLVARRLKYAFRKGRSFEYLMSRFSTPDELFGPVSISRLKDSDKFERITSGYLPDADVVFLDEIWKAGPSIQNALLTVINEKLFRNGDNEIALPLKVLIAASNELPARGEGLEALWDRFVVRCYVGCIESSTAFDKMLLSQESDFAGIDEKLQISKKEYTAWRKSIGGISVKPEALGIIHALKIAIENYNRNVVDGKEIMPLYVSDRRWRKTINILRTSAFLNGRESVGFSDMLLLNYMLWDNLTQRKAIASMLEQAYRDSVSDSLGIAAIAMKMDVLADEMKADNSHRELTDSALQVVSTFYYQLMGVRMRERVLVYISEYQSMRADTDSFFYMSRPKSMPGTIVLRKYDRVKAIGVAARDIMKVRRGARSVYVGDSEYPLLLVDGGEKMSMPETGTIIGDFSEKIANVKKQIELVEDTIGEMEKSELKDASTNLFLDDASRLMIERTFVNLRKRVSEFRNDIDERAHANKVENRDY